MPQRVIVQTQNEYASMNRAYLKWAIIIGGVIFGYMVISGEYNLPIIWGIIGFVPLGLYLIFKLKNARKDKRKMYLIVLGIALILILGYSLRDNFSSNKSPTDYRAMCEKACGGNLTISPLINAEYEIRDYVHPQNPQIKHLLECSCQSGLIAISLP